MKFTDESLELAVIELFEMEQIETAGDHPATIHHSFLCE